MVEQTDVEEAGSTTGPEELRFVIPLIRTISEERSVQEDEGTKEMTLNHSKTWPVSTLAVVQLRVDPNGRTYSTQFDADLVTDFEISTQTHQTQNGEIKPPPPATNDAENSEPKNAGVVLPLSQEHVELFTIQQQQEQQELEWRMAPGRCSVATDDILTAPEQHPNLQRHPYKTTIRTDTVSTILEQDNDMDSSAIQDTEESAKQYERFHVLALSKIEEIQEIHNSKPTATRTDTWEALYHEVAPSASGRSKLCPACTAVKQKQSPVDYNERLLVDLPLDARKATTLRRHYYPEGGWGWVIIACTMIVHILNVGLQLSCTQLAPSGAEKFKTKPAHIAEDNDADTIRITVIGDGFTGKTCLLIGYKDKCFNDKYIPTVFDSYSMNIDILDKTYTLILQDTAGQEDYDRLRPLGYMSTNVFIICYSIDREDSYKNVQMKWAKEARHFRPHCRIILVGTKVDRRNKNAGLLTFEDGLRLQEQIKADDFIECSAKELYNVDNVFQAALMASVRAASKRRRYQCIIL